MRGAGSRKKATTRRWVPARLPGRSRSTSCGPWPRSPGSGGWWAAAVSASRSRRMGRSWTWNAFQVQLRPILRDRDADTAAAHQPPEPGLLGQGPHDVLLDRPGNRAGTHLRVVAFFRDPAPRIVVEAHGHA